jgi:2-oxoacid:acceptor oxidoreductase delta subunit (pyruvate/2-ketoisovalerate family)
VPSELLAWQQLPLGGVVAPDVALRPRTGSYRTGLRPEVEIAKCVDCLLCWVYCPDTAIELAGTSFGGIDLDHCKGCEICAEVCPTGAIAMVAE